MARNEWSWPQPVNATDIFWSYATGRRWVEPDAG
jgi:hypothetical protein